jgi:hypothetical protein
MVGTMRPELCEETPGSRKAQPFRGFGKLWKRRDRSGSGRQRGVVVPSSASGRHDR